MPKLLHAFDGIAKPLLVFVDDMHWSAQSRPLLQISFCWDDNGIIDQLFTINASRAPCVPAPMRVMAFVDATIVIVMPDSPLKVRVIYASLRTSHNISGLLK